MTDRQTDTNMAEIKYFNQWNVFGDMCRMGHVSFCSWFDSNWSTFDEDMCKKRIFILPYDLKSALLLTRVHGRYK